MLQQRREREVLLFQLLLSEGRMDLAVTDLVHRHGLFSTMRLWNQVMPLNALFAKRTRTKAAKGRWIVLHTVFLLEWRIFMHVIQRYSIPWHWSSRY